MKALCAAVLLAATSVWAGVPYVVTPGGTGSNNLFIRSTITNAGNYYSSTGSVSALQFVGGGAGISNLNATALTSGTVPVARLPIGGITSGTRGTVFGDGTTITVDGAGKMTANVTGGVATNVYEVAAGTNVVVETNGYVYTISSTGGGGSPQTNISYVAVTNAPWLLPDGDGSLLTGILATNTTTATWTNSGSVDSNMVAHIYANPRTWEIRRPTDGFCTYPSSTYTEAQVIQAASNMWVRGYVAAGMDTFELSDGWGNTNRTVGGALMYNTANFPSGMPWVVEHCRTNYGVKIGFYLQGANNVTNTVSVWGSIPTTDFAHLDQDMNTIVGEWGASHIRSDWFGFDNWDVVRAFVERLTYVADYAGKTNIYNQRPISFQWFTDLPVWWDAGEPSAVPPFMADYANVMRVGSDHSSRELVLSGLEFMKHYFHLIGPGHYIFTDTEMDSGSISGLTVGEIRRNIGLGALMHSPLQFTWNGLATDVPTYTYKEEWFTNSRLKDIRWDAAVNPPTIAYTNLLSGTNAGECWITKLQNGDYAVALWNRANTGGSLSNRISIEQAGLNTWDPQNGTYWTRDATSWTNANGYTLLNDPSGTDRGIYWWTTNSTYGMSYYYLYPALTNVNGSEWIATNGFVNGGSMKVFYDQGREMSFGTTNIAALGTAGWTYLDVWTGWYGTATNALTWSVPTNDLAIFRVSAPAIWPVAATAIGNIDGSNVVSGTVAPARLGSGSGGATKFLREDSTWQTLGAGSGDVVASGNNNLSGSNNFSGVTVFSNDVVLSANKGITIGTAILTNAGSVLYGNSSINLGSSDLTAANLVGAGSDITALDASNLASGTVPTNRLATLLAANVTGNAATVTTITEAQITNALGATLQKNISGNAATASGGWLTPNQTFTGTNSFTVGTRTFTHDGAHTLITNTATQTASEWTAGSQLEWYKGTNTMTIDKTNGNLSINGTLSANNIVVSNAVTLTTLNVETLNATNLNVNATNIIGGAILSSNQTFTGSNQFSGGMMIWGDANKTNGVLINASGQTLSNSVGSVTIAGGNLTVSQVIKATNGLAPGILTVATLPSGPVAGQTCWASDVVTSRGTGDFCYWDGTSWRTRENVVATTDIPTFMFNAYTSGFVGSSYLGDYRFKFAIGMHVGELGLLSGGTGGSQVLGNSVTYLGASTSTSASGVNFSYGPYFISGTTNYAFIGASAYLSAMPTAAENFYAFMGLSSASGWPAAAAIFLADPMTNKMSDLTISGATGLTNNWICATTAGSTWTFADSGLPITISAATANTLSVSLEKTQARFFTNGVLCATITSTLPTNNVALTFVPVSISKTNGTTARYIFSKSIGTYFRNDTTSR